MIEITKEVLKKIYKERKEGVRKYDFGLLLVIGGSEFYSGSPALSSLSAFKSGVDMVRIIAPKRAADIIASFTPNLAAYPIESSYLTEDHLDLLLTMTESARVTSRGGEAVIIGGGMGRSESTQKLIKEYLSKVSVPVIVDADGINALSENLEIIKGKPFLLTPHGNEFFMLTKKNLDGLSFDEKINIVKEEANRLKTTILLKGGVDIISNGEEVALNKSGSPFMTKGGMGDTLAGIAGALVARGVNIFEAAQAAAYINGRAGELAIKKHGESVMATDLIECIPEVIKN